MADRSQINIRVDTEKKEKWKKCVDESKEYKSLTHLIEKAVAMERNSGQDDRQSTSTGGEVDELKDEIADVRNAIGGLESEIEDLRQVTQRAVQQGEDTQETDTERYQTVLSHVPNEKKTSSPTGGDVSRSTTDMVAEETGYSHSAVDYYLELAAKEDEIQKDTVDGVTVYWKGGKQ